MMDELRLKKIETAGFDVWMVTHRAIIRELIVALRHSRQVNKALAMTSKQHADRADHAELALAQLCQAAERAETLLKNERDFRLSLLADILRCALNAASICYVESHSGR